jgi:cell division septation protein DedD
MSKTDGEYELVLGNRQLLSAFFIVVILFGVFFTMGYVVGRNSSPPAEASAPPLTAGGKPEAASPAVSEPPAQRQPLEPPKEAPPVVAKPEPAEERRPAAPKPVSAPPEKSAPLKRPVESAAGGVVPINPGPGRMYLQVAAAGQPQAKAVVDTLRQKGFPAFLSPGPRPDLVRVVVGPFAAAATLGKAKADLESAGFHPIVRK